jgi:hypothetical protein
MRRIGIRTAEAGGFPRNVGPPGLGDLDEPTQRCQPGPVHRRRPLAMAAVWRGLAPHRLRGSGPAGRPQTSAPGLASDASTASPAVTAVPSDGYMEIEFRTRDGERRAGRTREPAKTTGSHSPGELAKNGYQALTFSEAHGTGPTSLRRAVQTPPDW